MRSPARTAADQRAPGPPYSRLRFQIDRSSPPPRRDVRYVLIVLWISITLLGAMTLGLSAIITEAVTMSAGSCASGGCAALHPGLWFLWLALPLIALDAVLLLGGIWWARRGPRPAP